VKGKGGSEPKGEIYCLFIDQSHEKESEREPMHGRRVLGRGVYSWLKSTKAVKRT